MKVVFACPTYGPTVDPKLDKARRLAIMYAANQSIQWMGDVSHDRLGWAKGRSLTAKEAVEARTEDGEEADGLMWCDDDIIMPTDAFYRLITSGKDMISGMYFSRGAPYAPVCAKYWPEPKTFSPMYDYPADTIAPMDGVGFGIVYTSIRLLKAVAAHPDCGQQGPFGGDFGNRTYGEDFLFCLRAKDVGFQPYVDTGILCDHYIAPQWANEKLYRSLIPKGTVPVK